MTFYEAKLKIQIGKYPVGTKFECATIIQKDGGGAILQLCNFGESYTEHGNEYAPTIMMGEYRLHYRVGDAISESS